MKRISIVFQETDGLKFNVFLEGFSEVRKDEIDSMTPQQRVHELSTAEFWAFECFQIVCNTIAQAFSKISVKK